jgi:hypothetical protein
MGGESGRNVGVTVCPFRHRCMVLLQVKKNGEIGNGSFGEKKKTLKDSAFILTAETAKSSDWGAKEIKARQAKMANPCC